MLLTLKSIYQGKVVDVTSDGDNLFVLNDKLVNVYDGNDKEITASQVQVVQDVVYHLNEQTLYKDGIELCQCLLFHIFVNDLKQHIVFSYNENLILKITCSSSSTFKEQFNISIIDFSVISGDRLLILTAKNLAIYRFGQLNPLLVINESKLALPFMGAARYNFCFDSLNHLYIARYKGACIYNDKNNLISNNYIQPFTNGKIHNGLLYSNDGNITVQHMFTGDSAALSMSGELFKTKNGVYLYTENTLYQICVTEYKDILNSLLDKHLYPMALDFMQYNEKELIFIKQRFVKHLIVSDQFEDACTMMLEIKYPLVSFLSQFPEVVPSNLSLKSIGLDSFPTGGEMIQHRIFPFLSYLSTQRQNHSLVDTILFNIYAQFNHNLLTSLVRVENNCDVSICGPILLEKKLHSIWILLYFTKGLHDEANQIMQSIPFESKFVVEYFDLACSDNVNWVLSNIEWYLKRKELDFILKHPALQQHQMQLFEILSFDLYLQRQYLLQIKSHSTLLIMTQLKIIKEADMSHNLQERSSLRQYLVDHEDYDGMSVKVALEEMKLEFEVALVCKRLKLHKEALEIYLRMNSIEEAYNYCEINDKNVYPVLYKLILDKYPKLVLEYISKYAEHLDPLDVLDHLKLGVSLSELGEFLTKSFKMQQRLFEGLSVRKNELKVQHTRLGQEKYLQTAQFVKIDAYKVCFHCNKRIGDKACVVYHKNLCCANCVYE